MRTSLYSRFLPESGVGIGIDFCTGDRSFCDLPHVSRDERFGRSRSKRKRLTTGGERSFNNSKTSMHRRRDQQFACAGWRTLRAKVTRESPRRFSALGDACAELGFIMDFGSAMNRRHPGAFDSAQVLAAVGEQIVAPDLLGNAIFAQWRYVTHWGGPLTEGEARELWEWFALALKRLASLTS